VVVALLCLAGLCLWAGLHPFTSYPASLWLVKQCYRVPLPQRLSDVDMARLVEQNALPEMAFLLCAYNEAPVIEAKINNMLALQRHYPKLSIYVYVDAATDRTAEVLERYRGQIFLHVAPQRMGKSYGMNLLMTQATAPIVVFTDATVLLDGDVPLRLLRYFKDPAIGCVCGHMESTNRGDSVTAATGSRYLQIDQWTKRLESETGSAMSANGSLFAIRRELHRPTPVDLFDDSYLSFVILCDGHRVVQADDVVAREESVTSQREEYLRKVRIGCQAHNVHLHLWPRIRRLDMFHVYKYVSHKWLRWFMIYFLGGFVVTFPGAVFLAGWYGVGVGLLVVGGVCLIGGYLGVWPFSVVWDVVVALAGTGVGVVKSLRGVRFQTWTPAGSIRK